MNYYQRRKIFGMIKRRKRFQTLLVIHYSTDHTFLSLDQVFSKLQEIEYVFILNHYFNIMVTFVCRHCDATLKKKQTENHALSRCRPASFICIDCHKTFTGNDYKAHISCLTEFEKHWGDYAKPKQKSKNNRENAVQVHNKAEENNLNHKPTAIQSHKQVVVSTEQKKQVQQPQEEWRGWKNEIKAVIKQHKDRVKVEDLKEKVLKRFKVFEPETDLKEQQLQTLFSDKLSKLKKVKLVTYVELS